MKKIAISLFLATIVVISGCGANKETVETKKIQSTEEILTEKNDDNESTVRTTETKETIEGYWMDKNGNTISFDSKGQAICEGIAMNHSLYGKNKLSISFLKSATEYKYSVENDVLTLVELKNNIESIYYRNEEKQQEIQKRLQELQAEKEKQEKIAEEKRIQEEYAQECRNKIAEIDNKISDIHITINTYKNSIEEHQKSIQRSKATIEEYEEKIIQIQNSNTQGPISEYKQYQQNCCAIPTKMDTEKLQKTE